MNRTYISGGEKRKHLLFHHMLDIAKRVPRGTSCTDVIIGKLFEFVEVSTLPDFESETQFTNAIKNSNKIHPNLRDALYQAVYAGGAHYDETIKVLTGYSWDELNKVYEGNLPIKPFKAQEPQTIVVSAPKKTKKQDKRYSSLLNHFVTEGTPTTK